MKSKAVRTNDKTVNVTHKNTIHRENIKKEIKYFSKNLMENFQLNPHSSKRPKKNYCRKGFYDCYIFFCNKTLKMNYSQKYLAITKFLQYSC